MKNHLLHKPALIAAVALLPLTVTACSGSDSKTSGDGSSSADAVEASKDPNAPVLPLGQVVSVPAGGATVESGQKRVVDLPAPNGGVLTVGTSALTSGTMPGVTVDDGKGRTAPDGGALLDISLGSGGLLPPIGSDATDGTDYTKPIDITVETKAGKSTQIASIKAPFVGKHWLASVPKDAATLTLSTDGGKQIVDLATGKRDDTNSNGLPINQVLAAPVTSAWTCDTGADTTKISATLTADAPMKCGVRWHAVDHYEGIGWAPKGQVLLIGTVAAQAPQLTYKKGSGFLDENSYGQVEHMSITATMDGKKATVVNGTSDTTWSKHYFVIGFPVTPTTKPNKLSMQITWTANDLGVQGQGFPAKVTATLPAAVTSTDSTNTIKTGPNPR